MPGSWSPTCQEKPGLRIELSVMGSSQGGMWGPHDHLQHPRNRTTGGCGTPVAKPIPITAAAKLALLLLGEPGASSLPLNLPSSHPGPVPNTLSYLTGIFTRR